MQGAVDAPVATARAEFVHGGEGAYFRERLAISGEVADLDGRMIIRPDAQHGSACEGHICEEMKDRGQQKSMFEQSAFH